MKNKYHLLIFLFMLGLINKTFCQEQFQLTQFINSVYAINPAFTGVEDDINVVAGFRRQWSAIETAPMNYYAGFSGTLSAMQAKFSDKRTLRLSVPRYYSKMQNEVGAIKHGVGMYLSGDHAGPFHQYAMYLSYALIYNFSRQYKVSLGASVNVNYQYFSDNNIALYFADQDQVYQNYLMQNRNRTEGHVNLGATLIGNNLFMGYSMHQAINIRNKNSFEADIDPGFYHYFLGGYNFLLNEQFTFQPSVYLRYNSFSEYSVNALARLKYRELFWTGIGYRLEESIGIMAGLMIEEGVRFSYSYDLHVNQIGMYSNGSHEISLGFSIYQDRTSREYLW